jgi:hypothetical protein
MPRAANGVSNVSHVKNEKTGSPMIFVCMQSITIQVNPNISSGFINFLVKQQLVMTVFIRQTN